jgi:hypothetical protein
MLCVLLYSFLLCSSVLYLAVLQPTLRSALLCLSILQPTIRSALSVDTAIVYPLYSACRYYNRLSALLCSVWRYSNRPSAVIFPVCRYYNQGSYVQKKKKLLKSYFSYTCHDRLSKRTAMMTPAALNAGDRIFCVGSRPLAYAALALYSKRVGG